MKKILLALVIFSAVVYLAYEALILVDNNFPFGRMWETPAVRPHEEKPLATAAGTIPFVGGEAVYRAADPKTLLSPLPKDDPIAVREGQILYLTYCAQCHGKNHDGAGTVGQSFAPLPADLRSQKVQALSEGAQFKEISFGVPGGRQPPLASTISVLDRWKIVSYVQSLGVRK